VVTELGQNRFNFIIFISTRDCHLPRRSDTLIVQSLVDCCPDALSFFFPPVTWHYAAREKTVGFLHKFD